MENRQQLHEMQNEIKELQAQIQKLLQETHERKQKEIEESQMQMQKEKSESQLLSEKSQAEMIKQLKKHGLYTEDSPEPVFADVLLEKLEEYGVYIVKGIRD